MPPITKPLPTLEIATCPSCGLHAAFEYVGEQIWPATVAQQMGIQTHVHLWTCCNCHSTFIADALNFDEIAS